MDSALLSRFFTPDIQTPQQQLNKFRALYLAIEISLALVVQAFFDFKYDWFWLWILISAHLALTVLVELVFKSEKYSTPFWLSLAVLLDLLIFIGLLSLTGAANNGLISMMLLPVAVAALILNSTLAYGFSMFACCVYAALLMHGDEHAAHHGMSGHLYSMWLSFLLSCFLLTWFISKQSSRLKAQSMLLRELREKQLRSEQLVGIATFAASAAHELGTPLSTIDMLSDELSERYELDSDIALLQSQVKKVNAQVLNISDRAQALKAQHSREVDLAQYIKETTHRWFVTHPEIEMSLNEALDNSYMIYTDVGFESALLNLLDNAAQSSQDKLNNQIDVTLKCIQDECYLEIKDQGVGFDLDKLELLGKAPVSSSTGGLGLGFFLANASLERVNCKLWHSNWEQGGVTRIDLSGAIRKLI